MKDDEASRLQQVDVNLVPRSAQVATLMRARMQEEFEGLGIALAGVPFDGGSSFRAGSRHGPAQMREMSRLIRQVGIEDALFFDGGPALNRGLVRAIEDELMRDLYVPEIPQITTAIGAARISREASWGARERVDV